MKIVVVGILIAILYSLGSAVFYLVKEGGSGSKRTLRALTFRVGLSVVLFLILILGSYMGWIQPHSAGF